MAVELREHPPAGTTCTACGADISTRDGAITVGSPPAAWLCSAICALQTANDLMCEAMELDSLRGIRERYGNGFGKD